MEAGLVSVHISHHTGIPRLTAVLRDQAGQRSAVEVQLHAQQNVAQLTLGEIEFLANEIRQVAKD